MKNNKLVFIILAIVLGISLVACSSEEATKDGHITLQYIYYETESGALFFEEESLGIDYFELNGTSFRGLPYTIYNLPGNEYYSYYIKAYDAEGTLMASGNGQWMVVEGFITQQTATLTVRHQHTFRDTWSSDESYHWHAATCGHDVRGNEAQHTFGSDTVVTAPTCTKAGTGSHTCTVCGYSVTYTIPATGQHTFNSDGVCTGCHLHEATGLYVFYDIGSYSDGWRYLEAAPADLRVVDGVPTVDSAVSGYSTASTGYVYGYYRKSDSGSNLYVNGTTSYNSSNCTRTAIGTGKTNTQLLVNAMGAETYSDYYDSSKTADYAAKLCDDLTYTVKGVAYSDWFLPSKDELNLMYENRSVIGGFANNYYYWSSSEYSSNSYLAWGQGFDNGNQNSRYGDARNNGGRVRPVRAF